MPPEFNFQIIHNCVSSQRYGQFKYSFDMHLLAFYCVRDSAKFFVYHLTSFTRHSEGSIKDSCRVSAISTGIVPASSAAVFPVPRIVSKMLVVLNKYF